MEDINLLEKVRSGFTPDVVQRIGSYVGESPRNTERVIGEAVPSLVSQMAEQVSSDAGATNLYQMAKASGEEATASEVTSVSVAERGQGVVSRLFGERRQAVTDEIAAHTGVSRGTASKILSFVGPAVLASIGREIIARGLSVAGLASLLRGQRLAAAGGVPVDFGPPPGEFGPAYDRGRSYREEPLREVHRRRPASMGWLPIALLGVVAVLGLFALLGRQHAMRAPKPSVPRVVAPITPKVQAPAAPAVQAPAAPAPTAPAVRTPETAAPVPTVTVQAPTAIGDNAEGLKAFLDDATAPSPRRFLFDLKFESASAQLMGDAPQNLATIASVLNQHPEARIEIHGYTDNVGDATQNRTLSQGRAETARDLLVQNGVDRNRISVSGDGADRPLATNDNEDGRAMNRRIELVVSR